ncbi:MAG: efflux RND transporter periplasmic adaptor subunit [Bacteroidota bacterium]
MKQVRWILTPILLLSGALIVNSCGQSDAKTEDPAKSDAIRPVTVQIEEVQLAPFTDAIQVTGIIKGRDDVMLSPEEGGVIKVWHIEKGQPVRKGDIIGVIKDDVVKASYEAAAAQWKLAEINFEMQKNMYAEKAISELQFKSAMYNRDAAKAQADLARARLERTRLRSPIDGVLNDTFADAGEFAPPAMPVAHIVSLQHLKIAAEISERYAGTLQVGNVALVIPDAFPDDTITARINYIGSAVNSSNRSLPIEMFISNDGLRLKPEMIAKVKVLRSSNKSTLLISENIVQLVDRGRNIVFVENGGVAYERELKLGSRQGNLVEVVEGLEPGDHLIVTGIQSLVNGQPVSVVQ